MRRFRILAVVFVVAIAGAACGPVDWPMLQYGPSHAGSSPDTSLGASDVGALMVDDWFTIPFDSAPAAPIVGNDLVYIGASNSVAALDVTRGDHCYYTICFPRWQAGLLGGVVGAPALSGGLLYAAAGDNRVYAFDGKGQVGCSNGYCLPLRTYAVGGQIVGSPVIANGVLYVATSDSLIGHVAAFDAAGSSGCGGTPVSCAPLWTTTNTLALTSSPSVDNGKLFVNAHGTLDAFDAAGSASCSGTPKRCQPLWTSAASTTEQSSPVVAGNIVFLGTTAFDASGDDNCVGTPTKCNQLFTLSAPGTSHTAPAVAGTTAYVTAFDAKVYAFDATGSTGCSGSPKTCTPMWTTAGSTPVGSSPSIANGILYVNANDGHVDAFDAAGVNACSGTPKVCSPIWTAATGATGTATAPAAVSRGHVYVSTADRSVYAFKADHTPPTTSIQNPRTGETVSSVVTTLTLASDDGSVASVDIHITGGAYDDALLGHAFEHDGEWHYNWDTTSTPNGVYTLNSVALDSVGHSARSADVTVTVQN